MAKKLATELKSTKCECCGHQRVLKLVNKLQFERHDVERKAYLAGDLARRGTEPTIAEEYKAGKWARNDIFMVNLSDGSNEEAGWDQLCVYPTKSGKPEFGRAKPFMTTEEIQWCVDENARMLEAEKKHGITMMSY